MTTPATRLATRRETALRLLSALEPGATLEINERELDVYLWARGELPEREFTRKRVERGHYKGFVLTRKS